MNLIKIMIAITYPESGKWVSMSSSSMGARRSSPSLFLFLCCFPYFSMGIIKSRDSRLYVYTYRQPTLCGLYVCLFVHVCTCAYSTNVCGGLGLKSNVFLHCSPLYLLKQVLSLKVELMNLTRPAGQWVLGICLSPPPSTWLQMHISVPAFMSLLGSQFSCHISVASTLSTKVSGTDF